MPFPHPEQFDLEKNLPAQPDPFIWLIEGQNPDGQAILDPAGAKVILRMTPNTKDVDFGIDSSANPITWQAYPITFGEISADLEGGRASVPMTLSGAHGAAFSWWEGNDFFRGHVVLLHLVHKNLLDSPTSKTTYRFRVSDSQASMEAITLNLAAGQFTDFDVPQQIITPTCRHTYRGVGCFFIGDAGNTVLGDCALTLAACRLRGAQEVTEGLDKIHPRNFGGVHDPPRGGLR